MAADYKSNLNQLKVASACFLPQCLGEDDRLAIEIAIRLRDLAVVPNGINYSLAAAQKAAAQWMQADQLSKEERQAITLYIDLQNAIDDGAQFANGTGINGLRKDAKCAACMGIEAKRNLLLFLKWKLNSIAQA